MNKKSILVFILIASIILSTNNFVCYASDNEVYYIDFLPMILILPEDYKVMTRDNIEDEEVLKFFKVNKKEAIDYFEQSHRYIEAVSLKDLIDITVEINQIELPTNMDLANASDEFMNDLFYPAILGAKEMGAKTSEYEIIKSNNNQFLKMFMELSDRSYYQYTTIYNGYSISIKADYFVPNDKDRISGIINNIVKENVYFGEKATQHLEPNEIVTYTDQTTGAIIRLPKGWTISKEVTDDRIKAVFKPRNNSFKNTSFSYSFKDILTSLSNEALIKIINDGLTRKDLDLAYIDVDSFLSTMNLDAKDLNSITCNGVQYFYIVAPEEVTNNKTINYMLYTVANGYLHYFMYETAFEETTDSEALLLDIEELLEGITFGMPSS